MAAAGGGNRRRGLARPQLAALILVAPNSLLTTDYGRVLLAKTVLVAAAAGLALAARRLLHRKSALEKIRRPTRVEAAALGMVIVLSSVLTVLPLPGDRNAPLAFPPPATGPVRPGGRAGRGNRRQRPRQLRPARHRADDPADY